VARPEHVRPVEGAVAELARLAERYRLVAIVTGRRSEEVAALLDVPNLVHVGLYGFEDDAPEPVTAIVPRVEGAAAVVPEAWVEDKRVSIAVHYRQAPDPRTARSALLAALQPVATEFGLRLMEGKMVLEFVPSDRPMKGPAVERLARDHGLRAVLYAGDDVADAEAFRALDDLEADGVHAVRVAVRGEETPEALVQAADVVVDGPSGLVELLRAL
jgi:trehalose 6-phosphate phosphatase